MAFPYNFSTVPADLKQLAQGLQANFRKAISGDSFTAAGDLLLGTGAGQYAKVAAGANGSVLTADSTQPGLVAWKPQTSRFKVGSFSVLGTTGNRAITGLGFTPGLIQFNYGWASPLSEVIGGQGTMDGSGNAWSHSWHENGAGARVTFRSTTLAVFLVDAATSTTLYAASFVSMDADGFTLNFSTANTSGRVSWIAYA